MEVVVRGRGQGRRLQRTREGVVGEEGYGGREMGQNGGG